MIRLSLPRLVLIALAGGAFIAGPAFAQLISNDPWRAAPQNRASIAFSMKAVEDGTNGPPISNVKNTTILCGGSEAAGATGNNNCIILNEATGAITTDQDSTGDQGASATDNSTNTNHGTQADELMDLLGLE